MASTYKTPGVYVEEISKFPPSVAQVETAIPAFIGYTEKTTYQGLSLEDKPTRIKSYKEFVDKYGEAPTTTFTINIATVDGEDELNGSIADPGISFYMNYCLEMYFANGGGPCYIISIGSYTTGSGQAEADKLAAMQDGLNAVKKADEPTMLLFPDAPLLPTDSNFYQVYKDALSQCNDLGDRVAIIDLNSSSGDFAAPGATFRNEIGNNFLKYGAAYFPWLRTSLNHNIDETAQQVTGGTVDGFVLRDNDNEASSLFHQNSKLYFEIRAELGKINLVLPPSSTMAGIYALVDDTRGVWKAPANVSLARVIEPVVNIGDDDQEDMNVTTSGKSVNAIRKFTGKGILVWGARTLAGNDNEWRYVPVRRFYNMVEESTKKASEQFVFEPNDANTWSKVKAMIENFLILQWRAGALAGAKPEDAFFVKLGLGETMSALDILEGRMIVEIGMAVVRPAEFIILRFSHKMQES